MNEARKPSFAVVMSFVAIVSLLPPSIVAAASLGWSALLLGALTYAVARVRGVSPAREMFAPARYPSLIVISAQREHHTPSHDRKPMDND